MSKHIITKYNLVNDYKKVFKFKSFIALSVGSFILLFLFLIVYLYLQIEHPHLYTTDYKYFVEIILTLIMCLFLIVCIFVIINTFSNYLTIKSGKHRIVTTTLAGIKEKRYYRHTENYFYRKPPRLHTLIFEKYGKYYILPKNYTSDPYTTMTDDQVANSSAKKDVFILVVNKKNKILLAYNTKLFEYQE